MHDASCEGGAETKERRVWVDCLLSGEEWVRMKGESMGDQ